MKKSKTPRNPPEGSPNARLPLLHQIAMQAPMNLDGLSPAERRYVKNVHKVLVLYWHKRMSREEAQAWQRFLRGNLGIPMIKNWRDSL